MKKPIIMLSTILLLSGSVFAKKDNVEINVPNPVSQAFYQKYQDVIVRKWEGANDTSIAEFSQGRRKHFAYFLNDGEWIKTETKIPMTKDLPVAVKDAWKNSNYASWNIAEVKKVECPDKKSFSLVVYQDCGPDGSVPGDCENIYKLSYNPDGTMINKEKIMH
jgi:hypothetical protein